MKLNHEEGIKRISRVLIFAWIIIWTIVLVFLVVHGEGAKDLWTVSGIGLGGAIVFKLLGYAVIYIIKGFRKEL